MERTDLEQWKSREVARLLTLIETQRRYYQDIVASIPVGLLVLSSDLAVILANAAARKALGLRTGDSLQRRLDTLLPRMAPGSGRGSAEDRRPPNWDLARIRAGRQPPPSNLDSCDPRLG